MLLIFSKVLVVFIYIGVGFIANRLKVLPEESVKHFISLVMESPMRGLPGKTSEAKTERLQSAATLHQNK
jgi:hypothetical protein